MVSLIAAAALILVCVPLLPNGWAEGNLVFNSPRTTVGYALSNEMAEQGHPSIRMEHAAALPQNVARALTPRDAASANGDVLPQDFAGTIIVHAFAAWLHPALIPFVAIIGAVLTAFAAARMAGDLVRMLSKPGRFRDRADRRARRIASIAIVVMPAMALSAVEGFSQDPLSTALVLFAASAFLRYWTWGARRDLTMMAVLFSAAVTFRYPLALLAIGPCVALLIRRKLPLPHLAVAARAGVAALVVILGFNTWVYGDPLTTGYSIKAELLRDTINPSDIGFDTPARMWIGNLRYLIELPFLLLPVLGMLCLSLPRIRRSPAFVPLLSLVGSAAFYTMWHAMQNLWGTFSLQANASILRYTLPVAGLGLVLLFVTLETATRPPYTAARTTFAVSVICIYAAAFLFTPSALLDRDDQLARGRELREVVVANTEPDAIIMSLRADKYLWPLRQTLTLPYLNVNATAETVGQSHPTRLIPPGDRIAYAAEAILDADIPLYLLGDFGVSDSRRMIRSLRRADLEVERATTDARLWSITS